MLFKIKYFTRILLFLSVIFLLISLIFNLISGEAILNIDLLKIVMVPFILTTFIYSDKSYRLKNILGDNVHDSDFKHVQKITITSKKDFSEIKDNLSIYFQNLVKVKSSQRLLQFQNKPHSYFSREDHSLITITWEEIDAKTISYTIDSKPSSKFILSDKGINRENIEKIKELLLT